MSLKDDVKKDFHIGGKKALLLIAEAKANHAIGSRLKAGDKELIYTYITNNLSGGKNERATITEAEGSSSVEDQPSGHGSDASSRPPRVETNIGEAEGGQGLPQEATDSEDKKGEAITQKAEEKQVTTIQSEAVRLHQLGMDIVLLDANKKKPVSNGWTKAAPITEEGLNTAFNAASEAKFPPYNIGCRLGRPYGTDGHILYGIDLDIRGACSPALVKEAKDTFSQHFGDINNYPCIQSGSGGESRHIYFASKQELNIAVPWHSAEKFTDAEGTKHWYWEIQIMAMGAQMVLPPSNHDKTGQPYRWINPFDSVPEFNFPEDILQLIQGGAVTHDQSRTKLPPFEHIDLPIALSPHTRKLIIEGEVKGSRSDAVYQAIKDLVKAGLSDHHICCILSDSAYDLSDKALENRGGVIESAMEWIQSQLPKLRAEVAEDDKKAENKTVHLGGDYYFRKGSIYLKEEKEGKDGGKEIDWVFVCSPLQIVANARSIEGSMEHGRQLAFLDRFKVPHNWVAPNSTLVSEPKAIVSELARLGLIINTRKPLLVADYINMASCTEGIKSTDKTGWHGGAFVLPDKVIGKQDEDIFLQTALPMKTYALSVKGTLEEWKNNVAKYAKENSRLMFAISHSFSAPLLTLLNEPNAGFHLVGPSSTGKTTILIVAASVMGNPKAGGGAVLQWRQTDNALEFTACQHNDLPMCLDELGQQDPRQAGQTVYMLANGQGKARSTTSGVNREPLTWRVSILSTGELSISSLMEAAGQKSKAGQELRLASIPALVENGYGCFENIHNQHDGGSFSRSLIAAAGRSYGAPMMAYLESLAANTENGINIVVSEIAKFETRFRPAVCDGQVDRLLHRFAIVAAAGELATSAGITGWEYGEATESVGVVFKAYLNERGGSGSQEYMNAISQVRGFIERHQLSRFINLNEVSSRGNKVSNMAGWCRLPTAVTDSLEQEVEVKFFIQPEIFKKEVCKDMDYKLVARALEENGFLIRGINGEIPRSERIDGKTRRVFHIKGEILD